jgi:ubiquinone/menaquinone biosynthesis C-methylase UbiE
MPELELIRNDMTANSRIEYLNPQTFHPCRALRLHAVVLPADQVFDLDVAPSSQQRVRSRIKTARDRCLTPSRSLEPTLTPMRATPRRSRCCDWAKRRTSAKLPGVVANVQRHGMTSKEQVMAKTRAAYHAAADTYDHEALDFWSRFGRATVARLGLRPREHVLDVCCGSGASAIPAAEAVGPYGRVLGVDLAPGLLDLARRKARASGLAHAEFVEADFESLAERDGTFDAVVCVFGIFLLPDMAAGVRRLWRWVGPGGRLAVTTWGPRLFEPANTIFWEAVRSVRPELYKGCNPWDRISAPSAVLELFVAAGIPHSSAIASPGEHRLRTADDWWAIVNGSGYRGVLELMTTTERETVREKVIREVGDRAIRSIETNLIYAVARKM